MNRLPSLSLGSGLVIVLPTLFAIPSAFKMFHQHKILNIIPPEIIEKRPEWADQEFINTPYRVQSMDKEAIKSYSFVDVLKMHRLGTNFVCPLVGSFTFVFLLLQMKHRLRILTPLERTSFAGLGSLGVMCTSYLGLMLHGYQWRDESRRRDLKHELNYRVGIWLKEERDPEWSKKIEFDEESGIIVPTPKSHFRK